MSFFSTHIAPMANLVLDDVHAQTIIFVAADGALGLNDATNGQYPGVLAKIGPENNEPYELHAGVKRERTREVGLAVQQTLADVLVTLPLQIGASFLINGESWVITEQVQRSGTGVNERVIYKCVNRKTTEVSVHTVRPQGSSPARRG